MKKVNKHKSVAVLSYGNFMNGEAIIRREREVERFLAEIRKKRLALQREYFCQTAKRKLMSSAKLKR